MVAWKVSGRIGLDRWLLPALGTPWRPGGLFRGGAAPVERVGERPPPPKSEHAT